MKGRALLFAATIAITIAVPASAVSTTDTRLLSQPAISRSHVACVYAGDLRVTAPNLAIWTEEGWVIENIGVPPDIEVEQTPAEVIAGRDPQLERAIQLVLDELKKNPPKRPARPPYRDLTREIK